MGSGGAVIVVVGAVLFIAVTLFTYQRNKKRREALQRYAAASGWSYVAEDDRQCARWVRPPFGEGFDRRARNVLSGQFRNHPMLAFDYTFKTQNGGGAAINVGGGISVGGNNNTETHHYRVCALALAVPMPYLELSHETAFTKVGHLLGMQDIQLESEAFNRRFRVHGSDPKFAYDVLTPRTMQALLAMAPYSWRIDGNTILSWAPGSNDVPDLLGRLTALAAVIDGIPAFVWHNLGVPPAPITPNLMTPNSVAPSPAAPNPAGGYS